MTQRVKLGSQMKRGQRSSDRATRRPRPETGRRRTAMPTKSQSDAQASAITETFTELRSKALETAAALSEANQRVTTDAIEFSSSAARETLRACAEAQTAVLDAVRASSGWSDGATSAEALFQSAYKIFETNAQI